MFYTAKHKLHTLTQPLKPLHFYTAKTTPYTFYMFYTAKKGNEKWI